MFCDFSLFCIYIQYDSLFISFFEAIQFSTNRQPMIYIHISLQTPAFAGNLHVIMNRCSVRKSRAVDPK